MIRALKDEIEKAWEDRAHVGTSNYGKSIDSVIELLNSGELRVAEPLLGGWHVNEWIKKAVLLYFSISKNEEVNIGDFHFYDKIQMKKDFKKLGVRVVPPGVARYGAFLGNGVILMPSYVNIGAYVDEGTMVDTWATVGSCAQIGKRVHLSGGVGIGGVLEPIQASPVIIEDDCFIGSRAIIVEGVVVEKEAVIGAGVILTGSTHIVDISGKEPVEYKGRVPSRSVVIPGSYLKKFPAGEYSVPCALIIGKRKESTDLKTTLNEVLRDYSLAI
jgi:2,3,4,5-tetrahydropyridine-2,6-dicarboxylate N-succinyltransferase